MREILSDTAFLSQVRTSLFDSRHKRRERSFGYDLLSLLWVSVYRLFLPVPFVEHRSTIGHFNLAFRRQLGRQLLVYLSNLLRNGIDVRVYAVAPAVGTQVVASDDLLHKVHVDGVSETDSGRA